MDSWNKYNMNNRPAAHNTAYVLRVDALALRDIAFGNVVYAGNVVQNCPSPAGRKIAVKI